MLDIAPFREAKKTARITLPAYPTSWKPVKDMPNLSSAKVLAIDTETKDPELLEAGPGWGRGVGHIVGISVATTDAAWYFPIRHEVQSELNMNPEMVLAWCRDVLQTNIPKVFANATYDLGWLKQEGVSVKGIAYDIINAEKILDHDQYSYSLEAIAQKYIGEGKVSDELYEWCSRAYGGKADGKQRANIYRTPPSLTGPYAESDARLPFDILKKQWKLLERAQLLDIFNLESKLAHVLVAMRMRGVPVSEEKAYIAREGLQREINNLQQDVNSIAGFELNVNSASDLERLFTGRNVDIEYTAKGNPSFQAVWLENCPDVAAQKIRDIRKFTKTISTFIDGAILNKQVNGRVYCSFNQLGAITGRFSSSSPNLQNIPSRDEKLGPLMRSIFMPEENHTWIKMDYSSVEFRVFAHFVQDLVLLEAYNKDPNTDFHKVVENMVGGNLPRVAYKTISFSQMFGGGVNTITIQMARNFVHDELIKLITKFGAKVLSNPAEQLARLIMNIYNERFPAVKDGLQKASDIAELTGEMRTVLGRRVQYNKWEAKKGRGHFPLTFDQAQRKWGANNIHRAKTYKALNVYTQGSSADIIKTAMVQAFEEGLFDDNRLGPPHLTVHDELDNSYHPDLREDFIRLKDIMENCVQLSVPLIVDADMGPNWGEVKKDFNLHTGVFDNDAS